MPGGRGYCRRRCQNWNSSPPPDPTSGSWGGQREGSRDRSDGGRPRPRSGGAHVRARRLGALGRLGRRRDQDRADRTGRRHARPGRHRSRLHQRGRARPPGALEPRQAQSGPRPHHARGPRRPLQVGGNGRRVSDQQAATGTQEAQHRARGHPHAQPEHHLRRRHGTGRARSRRRQGFLRLAVLLVPSRCLSRRHADRSGPSRRSPRAGLRRLHRGDDHRGRHHGCPVPPRADR